MLYLPHLEDMAKYVLDILQEGPEQLARASSRYSKARVVQAINSSYASATSKGQLVMRPELIRYQNIEVGVDGVAANFTWTSTRGQIIALTHRTGEDDLVPSEREILLVYSRINEGSLSQQTGTAWRVINRKLHVFRTGGSFYFRLWHLMTPPPLAQTTVTEVTEGGEVTASATATYGTIFPETDFYDDALLRIGSTPPVVRECTSSAVSGTDLDLEVQVAGDEDAAIFSGITGLEGAKLSVLPWFPEEYYEHLCYMASTKFTKNDTAFEIAPHVAQKLKEFDRFINMEDKVTPHQVVNLGNNSTGQPRDIRRRGGFLWRP